MRVLVLSALCINFFLPLLPLVAAADDQTADGGSQPNVPPKIAPVPPATPLIRGDLQGALNADANPAPGQITRSEIDSMAVNPAGGAPIPVRAISLTLNTADLSNPQVRAQVQAELGDATIAVPQFETASDGSGETNVNFPLVVDGRKPGALSAAASYVAAKFNTISDLGGRWEARYPNTPKITFTVIKFAYYLPLGAVVALASDPRLGIMNAVLVGAVLPVTGMISQVFDGPIDRFLGLKAIFDAMRALSRVKVNFAQSDAAQAAAVAELEKDGAPISMREFMRSDVMKAAMKTSFKLSIVIIGGIWLVTNGGFEYVSHLVRPGQYHWTGWHLVPSPAKLVNIGIAILSEGSIQWAPWLAVTHIMQEWNWHITQPHKYAFTRNAAMFVFAVTGATVTLPALMNESLAHDVHKVQLILGTCGVSFLLAQFVRMPIVKASLYRARDRIRNFLSSDRAEKAVEAADRELERIDELRSLEGARSETLADAHSPAEIRATVPAKAESKNPVIRFVKWSCRVILRKGRSG